MSKNCNGEVVIQSKLLWYYKLVADNETLDWAIGQVHEIHWWLKEVAESWSQDVITEKLNERFDEHITQKCMKWMMDRIETVSESQKDQLLKHYALAMRAFLYLTPLRGNAWMKEVLTWTKKELSALLSDDNQVRWATCINYSGLIKYLWERIWVSWKEKTQLFLPKIGHRYVITDDGYVIDPMWWRWYGGVFTVQEYYELFPQNIWARKQKNIL